MDIDESRERVDGDLELVGRQIADATVEWMFETLFVEDGGSETIESAANEKFIEAFKPPESIGIGDGDPHRMDGSLDGALPSEFVSIDPAFPDGHAAGGEEAYREAPGIDGELLHPLATAVGQRRPLKLKWPQFGLNHFGERRLSSGAQQFRSEQIPFMGTAHRVRFLVTRGCGGGGGSVGEEDC